MLLALWSPKGGTGTSVLAAATSLVAARTAPVCLVDMAGDQPAILGLAADPGSGVDDWLSIGPEAPSDALDRLAVDVTANLVLVPRGGTGSVLTPVASAEAGAALGVALSQRPGTAIADVGTATTPPARALLEVADVAIVVVRGCYLTLRRAVSAPGLALSAGVVLVDEPGRSLGSRDIADVLGRPVVARVPLRSAVGRAVDAGVFSSRMPDAIGRPARELLRSVGLETKAPARGAAA